MGFTNTEQLRELFLCGGMGFLLGLYYDVFRLLRLLLPAPAPVVFLQDVLFFITGAGAVFLFALAVTDGALRAYLFAGLAAGFGAYRCTVGRLVIRWTARLLRTIRRFLSAVAAPVRKIFTAGIAAVKNRRKKAEKI